MPLVRNFPLSPDARLCLWQISECEEELPQPTGVDLSHIHSASRRLETLAVYAKLHEATGCRDIVSDHEPSVQPTIPAGRLRISHTRGWAALMLAKDRRVAVDVEYFSDRVTRITDRFLRPEEARETLEQQLVAWCAKETVYKYFSEEDLQYFDMRLEPYTLQRKGRVEVSN